MSVEYLLNKFQLAGEIEGHFVSLFILGSVNPNLNDLKIVRKVSSRISNILYQTNLSNAVIAVGLQYFYRIIQLRKVPNLYKKMEDNVVLLLVVCLMISNKTVDDSSFVSKTWASVSKFPLKKLNNVEIKLLGPGILNFDVFRAYFHQEEFRRWLVFLTAQIPIYAKQYSIAKMTKITRPVRVKTRSSGKKLVQRVPTVPSLAATTPPGYSVSPVYRKWPQYSYPSYNSQPNSAQSHYSQTAPMIFTPPSSGLLPGYLGFVIPQPLPSNSNQYFGPSF